ncbi:hypothetical protein R3I93_022265 [Phoxinus phoxinus]|uniref:Uncharacterized protein n=1 Tax=Phoxinus phoxinus TaxID=58324 RepID=A0AAN9C8H5_9TELE
MGQRISCCCASDCVSVISLQDCTLQQQPDTSTEETHHPQTVGGGKVKESKKRKCLSLLWKTGKLFQKSSSGQGDKEEAVGPTARRTDDQTSQHITGSEPEDDDYWFDGGFQDLICSFPAVRTSVRVKELFTGHSEDDGYWCDGSFQDLVGGFV